MILPTIAYQLSMANNIDSPKYRRVVLRALKGNPDVASLSLRNQLDDLVMRPVMESKLTTVILVDALDECSNPEATSTFLDLLLSSIPRIPSMKVLITSRPERHIHLTFRLPHLYPITDVFVLHNVDSVFIDSDIKMFIRTKLNAVARSRRSDLELPDCWPSESEIAVLTSKAGELFIFAATAVKLIGSGLRDPRDQLQILADVSSSTQEGISGLDGLYMDILKKALPQSAQDADFERLRSILGLLVVAKDRMLPETLADLLGLERKTDVRIVLGGLRSVLFIPDDWTTPIRFYHKSFPDFLTDNTRCKDPRFFISVEQHDLNVTQRCLDVMLGSLKKNICGLPRYMMNANVDTSRIDQCIADALRYSCRHWVDHLVSGKEHGESRLSKVKQPLHNFLTTRQIYWFEALGLLRELKFAVYSLNDLYDWLASVSIRVYINGFQFSQLLDVSSREKQTTSLIGLLMVNDSSYTPTISSVNLWHTYTIPPYRLHPGALY